MSIASKVISGLAALTIAGGMTAAAGSWSAADAATPACGSTCVSPYPEDFGSGYLLAVESGRLRLGMTPDTVLSPAAQVPAEDWVVQELGTAGQLYQAGIVSAAVGTTWPSAYVFQWIWAPNGRITDSCLGVGSTAVNGTPVSLQTCGTPLETAWAEVPSLSTTYGFAPIVSGTDTRTSQPYALSVSGEGGPITTQELSLTRLGMTQPAQDWNGYFGVVNG